MNLDVRRYAKTTARALWALVTATLTDRVLQLAAALTYYTVLSLFPALFIIVSILGVIGLSPDTLQSLLDEVAARTDSEWAVDIVSSALDSILEVRGSTVLLSVSVLVSLYAASGYVYAFMWASDSILNPPCRITYFKTLPIRIGLALLLIVLFTAAVAMVTILGPLGDRLAAALHIANTSLYTWTQMATPLLLVAALLMLTLLYKFTPSRRPRFWRLFIGAFVTLAIWYIASAAFSFYLANFASYNEVYGTLGAAIAFLVWLWILNAAALFGVEVNRAVARRAGGGAAEAAGATDASARAVCGEAAAGAEAGREKGPDEAADEEGPGRLKRLEQKVVVDLAARLDAKAASYSAEAAAPDLPGTSADEGDEARRHDQDS